MHRRAKRRPSSWARSMAKRELVTAAQFGNKSMHAVWLGTTGFKGYLFLQHLMHSLSSRN